MQSIPEKLRRLAKIFPSPLYIVGGYVRNSLTGGADTDIDICGAAAAEDLRLPEEFTVTPVNKRLGTAVISSNGDTYEYTPFRLEKYPEGGTHTPAEVSFTDDIYKDSLRRDFTVNALYYDILNEKLIDFHNGVTDINNKIIRAISSPAHVFSSDGLRIMRLIRQSAEMGYGIDDATLGTAAGLVSMLKDISKERIRIELDKILAADIKYGVADAHYRGLTLTGELNAWQYIIPEVAGMAGVGQNPIYHKYDVYEHSLQCARFSPPGIRLAALMHDIGKPLSLQTTGKMHSHVTLGMEVAARALGQQGLKYPNAAVNKVVRLIEGHMYNRDGKTGQTKLRRFVARFSDILDDLIELIKADSRAKGYGTDNPNIQPFIDTRQEMLENNIPFSIKDLEIDGRDLIALGFSGTEIGRVLDCLFNLCLTSTIENNKETLIKETAKC